MDGPARTEEGVGGAPAFAEFITVELLPYIASRYRAMPFTVVAGHSMTGLFAAYLYGQSPTKINAVLAISPSLGWNGGAAYQQVSASLRARTTQGRFFLAASRDEGNYIGNVARQLTRDLEGHASATTFQFCELIGDSHANSPLQGSIDGLRFIFQPMSLAGTMIESWPTPRSLVQRRMSRKANQPCGKVTNAWAEPGCRSATLRPRKGRFKKH